MLNKNKGYSELKDNRVKFWNAEVLEPEILRKRESTNFFS